uniref:NADH dehydrogenase subunit 4L n=1 Tax=Hygrobates longiporus TaxID=2740590 RepID=A0A6J4EGC2_9ACAR|nr:NADH dehydrogenase subunit 4L [Hygrobates longiporus]BCG28124.1 NADH dehydrogenase subunit 4L [Hygrobates longiporus]
MKSFLFIGGFIFFFTLVGGFLSFIFFHYHYMYLLLSLEIIMVSILFIMIYNFLLGEGVLILLVLFLIFFVCESLFGISILIFHVRVSGIEMFSSM